MPKKVHCCCHCERTKRVKQRLMELTRIERLLVAGASITGILMYVSGPMARQDQSQLTVLVEVNVQHVEPPQEPVDVRPDCKEPELDEVIERPAARNGHEQPAAMRKGGGWAPFKFFKAKRQKRRSRYSSN